MKDDDTTVPNTFLYKYATRNMRREICDNKYATRNMRREICDEKYPVTNICWQICNDEYATTERLITIEFHKLVLN